MADSADAIEVFIRVRPPLSTEDGSIAVKSSSSKVGCEGTVPPIQFDHVFGCSSTQDEVFNRLKPNLERCLSGYKSTVLAYGQTGSGKTYSMMGENGEVSSNEKMGIIPRCTRFMFSRIASLTQAEGENEVQFQLRASFVEVYNGRAYDLLSSGSERRRTLQLRESSSGEVDIAHCIEIVLTSTEQCQHLLKVGSRNRATGSTAMNAHSSRSHAVFILHVEQRRKTNNKGKYKKLVGQINLVDLAGSEDVSRSKAEGERFTEAVQINTGLLQLHRVLEAASAGSKFIPYRDSVLTRLLQDSIGGSSRAVLLAHISPFSCDARETQSTLRYAKIAGQIKNTQVQCSTEVEEERHPLDEDFEDPEGLGRHTVFLNTTSHGKVFARVAGNPNGRLMLLVHGSGPANSSIWWNLLVNQLLTLDPPSDEDENQTGKSSRGGGRRENSNNNNNNRSRFYLVAIDCPGYGRTAGDRQTVRSAPGALFADVVAAAAAAAAAAAGRPGKGPGGAAYCLVGSSQGAAAVFNAALERPGLARFLAVMDPVSHDPARFGALAQPVLMCYDREDAGHPVGVGRVAARHLRRPDLREFSSGDEPAWLRTHFARLLLGLFARHDRGFPPPPRVRPAEEEGGRGGEEGGAGATLAGGVLAWLSPHGRERHACWTDVQEQEKEREDVQRKCEGRGVEVAEGEDRLFDDPDQNDVGSNEEEEDLVVVLRRRRFPDVSAVSEHKEEKHEEEEKEKEDAVCCCICEWAKQELPTTSSTGNADEEEKGTGKEMDGIDEDDSLLLALSKCKHAVCLACAARTLSIDPRHCPAPGCRATLPARGPRPPVAPPLPPALRPVGEAASLVLEFGNTAGMPGERGKVAVTCFLRVVGGDGGGRRCERRLRHQPPVPGQRPPCGRAAVRALPRHGDAVPL